MSGEKELIRGLIPKRTQGKYKADITLKTLYKEFKDQILKDSGVDQRLNINYTKFSTIIQQYLDSVMDKILNQSEKFELPYTNGILYIQKKKMNITLLKGEDFGGTNKKNNLKVDYKAFLANGLTQVVYELNEHSSNARYMFRWSKSKQMRKGTNGYAFVPARQLKRALAKQIFLGKDYWE